MSDVVVTVPLSFGWSNWIDEGDAAGSQPTGCEYAYYGGGFVPDIKAGERVYIVHNGRLRGYAPLVRIDAEGNRWKLIRAGGAVAVTVAQRIPGFRGWRRRWWRYDQEMPFPDWMVP